MPSVCLLRGSSRLTKMFCWRGRFFRQGPGLPLRGLGRSWLRCRPRIPLAERGLQLAEYLLALDDAGLLRWRK